MRKAITTLALLGVIGAVFTTAPARADDWHHDGRREWRDARWHEHEWWARERAIERAEWRERYWRLHHYYYRAPYYPPPVVTYAPAPYYPPGVSVYLGE